MKSGSILTIPIIKKSTITLRITIFATVHLANARLPAQEKHGLANLYIQTNTDLTPTTKVLKSFQAEFGPRRERE